MKFKLFWILIIVQLSVADFSFTNIIKCLFGYCCNENYVYFNQDLFTQNLNKLIGQPIATNTILSAIGNHFRNKNPNKALVLSFHGPSGVGKTYLSGLIADSLYSENGNKYRKLFTGFEQKEKVHEYKYLIQRTIEETVKQCDIAIFVFDEVDKMPIGLINVIKPYIDYNNNIDGISYKRSIFILLSNIAAPEISLRTLELHKQNIKREKFDKVSFHNFIESVAYGNNDTIGYSTIFEKKLIDYFVPFLPLERSHVKICIENELKKYDFLIKEADVDSIADTLMFEPGSEDIFISEGCKFAGKHVSEFVYSQNRRHKYETEL